MNYMDQVEKRRSYYAIDNKTTVENEKIETILGRALNATPSPFNMQSSRVLLLLDGASRDFWEKVNEALDGKIDPEKMAGFSKAKGTVLYFIDDKTVNDLAADYPKYADNFKLWAHHENAMLQHTVWVALRQEGLGASLQHYSNVIEDRVKKDYGIDAHWTLIAQMPFGHPLEEPAPKEKKPLESRLKRIEK